MDESHEITPARKRGRPRKSDGGHSVGKADEAETLPLPSTGKRKMVEAVLDSDNLKRSCNTRNAIVYQGRYMPAMPKDARNGSRKLLICTFMLGSTGIDHMFAIMKVASRAFQSGQSSSATS